MKPTEVLNKLQKHVKMKDRRLMHSAFLRNGPLQNLPWVTANRLGFQVARMLAKHASWRLRPVRRDQNLANHIETIERDGTLVLPNFLSPEQFKDVKDEYERSLTEPYVNRYKTYNEGRNWVSDQFVINPYRGEYPTLIECFEYNPLIHQIVEAVMRRRVNYPSQISLIIRHRIDPNQPHEDNSSNILHSDRHYPTVKVFFYLNDVDKKNGPYTYAKGSHKLTWARLRHEYEFSKRFALLETGAVDQIPAHLVDRGLNKVDDVYYRAMNIVETPICGRANTLIITNTMGFHRRGEFLGAEPRVTINLDFNYLESWGRPLFPILKRLPF